MVVKSLACSAAFLSIASASFAEEGPILGHETVGVGAQKVIVLHDWLGNAQTWDPIKPYLNEDQFTFVFADVRGYGMSKDLSGAYTADEIASDVLRLADHLNYNEFHFIGHSMNGMTGFRLAMRADQRITSLILVTPILASGYPASQEDRDFFAAIPHNPEVTAQAFAGLTGGRYLSTWGQHKANINITTSTEDAMQGYRRMVVDGGFEEELHNEPLTTPTLIIAGRHDLPGVRPEYLQKVAPTLLKDVDIEVLEASGHYPMDETPIALVTLIDRFLGQQR